MNRVVCFCGCMAKWLKDWIRDRVVSDLNPANCWEIELDRWGGVFEFGKGCVVCPSSNKSYIADWISLWRPMILSHVKLDFHRTAGLFSLNLIFYFQMMYIILTNRHITIIVQ